MPPAIKMVINTSERRILGFSEIDDAIPANIPLRLICRASQSHPRILHAAFEVGSLRGGAFSATGTGALSFVAPLCLFRAPGWRGVVFLILGSDTPSAQRVARRRSGESCLCISAKFSLCMDNVNSGRYFRSECKFGAKKKRPGGVDRALGNRPMGDWTASELNSILMQL